MFSSLASRQNPVRPPDLKTQPVLSRKRGPCYARLGERAKGPAPTLCCSDPDGPSSAFLSSSLCFSHACISACGSIPSPVPLCPASSHPVATAHANAIRPCALLNDAVPLAANFSQILYADYTRRQR